MPNIEFHSAAFTYLLTFPSYVIGVIQKEGLAGLGMTIDFLKLNDKFSVVVKVALYSIFVQICIQDSGCSVHRRTSIHLGMNALLLNDKLTVILNLSSSFKKSNDKDLMVHLRYFSS